MSQSSGEIERLEDGLRAGDGESLARLFAVHRPRLLRIAAFRLNPHLAARLEPEDVVQETWLAASHRLDRFASDGFQSSFLWLRLILNQCLVEAHRKHLGAKARDARREIVRPGPGAAVSTSVSLASRLVGDLTSPSRAAARNELFERVERTIASLDPNDQEILALRHFEELSNGEAARVLGIEQKAASIRYVRALRRLKKVLADVPGFTGLVPIDG